MKKHPVLSFYLIAIFIAWIGWLPIVLGSQGIPYFQSPVFQFLLIFPAIGPMLATVIVLRKNEGKEASINVLRNLFQWRINTLWYVIALIIPVVLLFLGKWITDLLGLSVKPMLSQSNWVATLLTAFFIALVANPWEEVGWRGFALPRLQKKYNAFSSSIVVGIMWAFWHLPLFFWLDNPMSEQSFWLFFIETIGAAGIYTWLYNSTNGSVFLVALYHIAWNTFGGVITGVSETILLIETWIVVIILLVMYGTKSLSSSEKVVTDQQ